MVIEYPVETVDTAISDFGGGPSRVHGTLRRSALILLGSVAGVLVGFALLTALARPASAASLPVAVTSPPAATAASTPPDNSVGSGLVAGPDVSGVVADAPGLTHLVNPAAVPVAVTAVLPSSPASIPTVVRGLADQVQTLSSTVSSTASDLVGALSSTVPPLGSVLSSDVESTTIAGPARPSIPGATDHVASATAGRSALAGSGAAHSPSSPPALPTSPTPLPTPAAPLQITPLTANDTSGSPAGQGGALFGSPSPASLLPPVPSTGGVRPVREKVPQLLLASRCTPPG